MSELSENVSVQDAVQTHKRRRRILIFGVVSLLNVGLIVLIVTQLLTPASHTVSDPLVDRPAPNFSLSLLRPQAGENALSLASLKGHPVVLNFWASWCEPCKEEAPLLEKTWKQMQGQEKDVALVGIDFEEAKSDGIGFLQSYAITYPAVSDANGTVASKYNVTGLPQTIFINRNGEVVSRAQGQLTAQILSKNLQLIM